MATVITPEPLSFHSKRILDEAVDKHKDYIATCHDINLFDYINKRNILQDVKDKYFFYLTKKNEAYLVTNKWIQREAEIIPLYTIVPKVNFKLKQNTIQVDDIQIGEAQLIQTQNKKTLLDSLLSLFKTSRFKLKVDYTFKYRNPIDRFPFEIMYNIFSTTSLMISTQDNRISIQFGIDIDNGYTYVRPEQRIEQLLIPLTTSWITQSNVSTSNTSIVNEQTYTFIESMLRNVVTLPFFNTYKFVIMALKLKCFYEAINRGD